MYEQSPLLVLMILGGLILKFCLKIVIYMAECQTATMNTFLSSSPPLGQGKELKTSRLFLLTV